MTFGEIAGGQGLLLALDEFPLGLSLHLGIVCVLVTLDGAAPFQQLSPHLTGNTLDALLNPNVLNKH